MLTDKQRELLRKTAAGENVFADGELRLAIIAMLEENSALAAQNKLMQEVFADSVVRSDVKTEATT